jgi:hypothetical protein
MPLILISVILTLGIIITSELVICVVRDISTIITALGCGVAGRDVKRDR